MTEPGSLAPTVIAYVRTLVALLERSIETGYPIEEGHLSPAEIVMMEAFAKIGLEPKQQYGIGPYAADFYFEEVRLVVEIDGRQHLDPERQAKDRKRDQALVRKGFRIARFPARWALDDADGLAREVDHVIDLIVAHERAEREPW